MKLSIFKMAFKALISNKIRSILSILGIIIGVSTVIIVVGIGLGAQAQIEEQYKNLSVTSIIINPVNTATSFSKLGEKDPIAIKEKAEFVSDSTVLTQGKLTVSYGKENSSLTILGTEKNLFELSHLGLLAGRYFEDSEMKNRGKVTILGNGAFEELFGNIDPKIALGKTISIGKNRVEIIGVLTQSGSSIGPIAFDDSVFTPFTTASKKILGSAGTIRIIALATEIETIPFAMEELGNILRENHRLKLSQMDDFRMKDQGSKVTAAKESAETMTILLTVVATVVLIVSGIGIMNVMLVTVSERTKEIGVLKAIGAKQADILIQFLAEAIVLSLGGGILGILFGQALIPALNTLDGFFVIHSVVGVVLAFSFSAIVGVIFGFYPAWKGSKLDPVDALRSE